MINLANFSSIFIGNWKLNGNLAFIKAYFDELKVNRANCVVICPPSLYLNKMNNNKENLFSGAQDVSRYNKGAYTGEFSAEMLSDLDVSFCIVGHSERRQNFNEDNITIEAELFSLDGSQRFYEKKTNKIDKFKEIGTEIGKILKIKSNNSYKS